MSKLPLIICCLMYIGHVYAIVDSISAAQSFSTDDSLVNTAHNVSNITVCKESNILDMLTDLFSFGRPRDMKNNSFRNCNPSYRLGELDESVETVDPA